MRRTEADKKLRSILFLALGSKGKRVFTQKNARVKILAISFSEFWTLLDAAFNGLMDWWTGSYLLVVRQRMRSPMKSFRFHNPKCFAMWVLFAFVENCFVISLIWEWREIRVWKGCLVTRICTYTWTSRWSLVWFNEVLRCEVKSKSFKLWLCAACRLWLIAILFVRVVMGSSSLWMFVLVAVCDLCTAYYDLHFIDFS